MREGSDGYEDCYLLDGSAALDVLNDAAVTGSRKAPHDDAAKFATDTSGGLYKLTQGLHSNLSGSLALWISKPRGESYQRFYESVMESLDRSKCSLWRRQMVLGPTPEFCALTASGVLLPELLADLKPIRVRREVIWQSKTMPPATI